MSICTNVYQLRIRVSTTALRTVSVGGHRRSSYGSTAPGPHLKYVPNPSFGVNQLRFLRVVLDLGAQATDIDFQIVDFLHILLTPYLGQ